MPAQACCRPPSCITLSANSDGTADRSNWRSAGDSGTDGIVWKCANREGGRLKINGGFAAYRRSLCAPTYRRTRSKALYRCMSASPSRAKPEPRPGPREALRQNGLLARLPDPEVRRWSARGETVRLAFGQVLYHPGDLKRHVYFPLDSYISQISSLAGVPCLEVGLVGSEGMGGLLAVRAHKTAGRYSRILSP